MKFINFRNILINTDSIIWVEYLKDQQLIIIHCVEQNVFSLSYIEAAQYNVLEQFEYKRNEVV